jgi:acyl phosphate:glycerol-3-phosphate acyltransferase
MKLETYIAIAIVSYFVGSIPTAYLLIRRASGKDLRREGTGNIGAMNAYEVSRSRSLGLKVLAIDLCKGAIAVLAAMAFSKGEFIAASTALVAVVLGHNYSPWIGWKGGRGLATAAGGSLCINPILVLLWALFWLLAFFPSRNVHFGNVLATLLAPVALLFLPGIAHRLAFVDAGSHGALAIASAILCAVLLLRHLGPMRDLMRHGLRPAKNVSQE